MQQRDPVKELWQKMERHMANQSKKTQQEPPKRHISPFRLAQLQQRVNSRKNSGWSGSRREQEHCKKWGIKPTLAERVV